MTMQYGPEYWGTVIAARVQVIPSDRTTADYVRLIPAYDGVRVTAQLFTDDPGRFAPGGLVRVGADLPPIGGIRAGVFVIEDATMTPESSHVNPFLVVTMRSAGPITFQDPMSGAALSNPPRRPLPVTPPPPPPPLPVARPQRRKPVRPADPPTYDAPGRRINLDD